MELADTSKRNHHIKEHISLFQSAPGHVFKTLFEDHLIILMTIQRIWRMKQKDSNTEKGEWLSRR